MPYAAGQKLTAADMNGADGRWITAQGQVINISAGGSGTAIPFGSGIQEYNNGGLITLSSSTFTLGATGLWEIKASSRQASSADGVTKILYLLKMPGSVVLVADTEVIGAIATPDATLSVSKRFTSGDQLQLYAFSSAASSIDTAVGQNQRTAISIEYRGP